MMQKANLPQRILAAALWVAMSSMLWIQAASFDFIPSDTGGNPGITIRFYSLGIELPAMYGSELVLPWEINKEVILDTYEHFQNCNYQPFLQSLQQHRQDYGLSDWHLYEVTARASETMFQDSRYQIIFQWFVLRKAGLDAQLFYNGSEVYLHAPARDVEFGFYTLDYREKHYVNLTAYRDSLPMDDVRAYVPDLIWDGQDVRPMVLELDGLPEFPEPKVIQRLLEFKHEGQTHRLTVDLNHDHLSMMDDYPYYNQAQYFHTELSEQAAESLLPKLEEMLRGRNRMEKVSFLLSFVRTAFLYKDDQHRFGHEKPMDPEQTLYYSYSDCEDRSALFFYLVRKVLKVPAIVLDFDEHVGVALELPEAKGEFFRYGGRRYVYCEATGPSDDLKIGEMWEDVRQMKARVMTQYLPAD